MAGGGNILGPAGKPGPGIGGNGGPIMPNGGGAIMPGGPTGGGTIFGIFGGGTQFIGIEFGVA